MDPSLYPKDFLWGASTSAHQVEGGTENDWSEWELAHASELANSAPKRYKLNPSWRKFKDLTLDPENYVSGRGVEHYKRYEEDFDLLEELQFNSFRFSIEWSRIEPKEGAWNLEAVKHYHHYIKSLNKRGIEPILTIWHWTMPTWFAEKGGFEKKSNIVYFEEFVKKIADEYGKEVRYVITLNEPNVFAALGYVTGERPPQMKSVFTAFKVYMNLCRAHRKAHEILKSVDNGLQVGVSMAMSNMQPKSLYNPLDWLIARTVGYAWNWWFLSRIRRQQDFIGVNYYFTDYIQFFARHNPTTPVSDLGWYLEPEGLLPILTHTYSRFKKPIIITENGLADSKDRLRKWWIEQTIIAMTRALSQGVDLRGYLHWSLLDNFEWESGWWPKFGLVAVDRDNDMKRAIRPSARWLANYLKKLDKYQVVRSRAHGRKLAENNRSKQPDKDEKSNKLRPSATS